MPRTERARRPPEAENRARRFSLKFSWRQTAALGMGNSVARVSPDPLDRPRIKRSTSGGRSRAAPVGAQVPWTTWGRFAHDSPRARVEVHLPCVLESRSAGQRALAPPTDGHPPDFRKPQRQFNHYTTISPTIHEPLSTPDTDTTNRNSTTTFSQPFPQLSCNRFPTPHQLSGTSTHPQPTFNRQTDDSALGNNHAPTILRVESKNDSDTTIPHPRSLNRQH